MRTSLNRTSAAFQQVVLAVSLLLTVALGLRDADVGSDSIVTATVVLGPLLASLVCTTRQVALVAGVALGFGLLSLVWTPDPISVTHQIRQLTVLAGSIASVLIARSRERTLDAAAIEQRFGAALDAMSAAVLLQSPGRGIVYANRAAAEAFGVPDAAGVVGSTPEQIAEAWITTDEQGRPLTADRYPSRLILTGIDLHPEPLITRGVHKETGRQIWMRVTATPVFAVDGKLELAVSVSEDITAIKRGELFSDILARTGQILGQVRSDPGVLQELAELVVPDLADWCTVSLRGSGKRIDQVAVAHRDPEKVEFARAYRERYPSSIDDEAPAAAILRGEDPILAEVTPQMIAAAVKDEEEIETIKQLGLRWLIQAPITASDGTRIGALTLINAESMRRFTEDELELAMEIGRRMGSVIEAARLHEDQAEAATVLQMALMPREIPKMRGFESAATYRPVGEAHIVGGDFYDAFRTATSWVLVVGDIVGRGIKAASLTAQARHVMRSNTMFTGDIVEAIVHLNRVLVEEPQTAICTIGAIELPDDPKARPARIICAGHPQPVLVREGAARQVGDFGPMVGAFADSRYAASELRLAEGDLLVLYTDGLTDAKGGDGRFGEQRLLELLGDAGSADQAISLITTALADYEADARSDDTAVVAVRYIG